MLPVSFIFNYVPLFIIKDCCLSNSSCHCPYAHYGQCDHFSLVVRCQSLAPAMLGSHHSYWGMTARRFFLMAAFPTLIPGPQITGTKNSLSRILLISHQYISRSLFKVNIGPLLYIMRKYVSRVSIINLL